jgi:hypothetical protein
MQERQVTDIEGFRPVGGTGAQGALAAARAARIDAELAGCEMEELTAALHRKPPVGRWPQLTPAAFGPSVAVLSG